MKLLAKHGQKQVVFFVSKLVANPKFDRHLLHSKSDQLEISMANCGSHFFNFCLTTKTKICREETVIFIDLQLL